MKTLEELKQNIWNKFDEVESLKYQKSNIERHLFNESGQLDLEVSQQFLAKNKEINYAQGAVIRMVKRLMVKIYGNWPWSGKEDYLVVVVTFKKFCC